MNIKKALELKQQILSEFGFNGLYYREGSDNQILFTMEVYALFKELGIFDAADKGRLQMALYYLNRRNDKGEPIPGLYNRRPGANERKDQWDNYEAIACSVMFGDEFRKYAREILQYGRKFFWYSYDNRSPYKFSINNFWKPFPNWNYFECCRQGWNVFTYEACAGHIFNPFWYLWYVGKCFIDTNDPTETSGKLITWLRYKALGGKWYMRPFARAFERKMKRLYGPEGIVAAFRIYHGKDATITKLAECLL